MKAKYRNFVCQKLESHEAYSGFIDGLYPAPTRRTIKTYRKKFYKKYYDPDFDPTFEDEDFPFPEGEVTWCNKLEMFLYAAFLCLLPVGVLMKSYYHLIAISAALIFGLLGRHGMPSLSKEYGKLIISDNNLSDLATVVMSLMCSNNTVILMVPLIFVAIVYISNSLDIMAKKGNFIAKLFNFCFLKFADSDMAILQFKCDLEIFTALYVAALIPFRWVSFIYPLFYVQMMVVRYMINKKSQASFDKLAEQMDTIIAHPYCLFPLRWILLGLRKAGAFIVSSVQSSFAPEAAPAPQPPAAEEKKDQAPPQKEEGEKKAEGQPEKKEEEKKDESKPAPAEEKTAPTSTQEKEKSETEDHLKKE